MSEWLQFSIMGDERGSLIALEENKNIPFAIKRIYYIFGTQANAVRGKHAHRDLAQVLICVAGNCRILVDDGNKQEIIALQRPDVGLRLRGLIWREMYDFSPDCVLLVLADSYYDERDYIRNYDDFLKQMKGRNCDDRAGGKTIY